MDQHLVMFFTAILVLIYATNFGRCGLDDTADEEDAGTYDFVIIGAGSGGSVLANRLSEVANWKILLVEAGKEEMFLTDIPLLAPILHITDYNWGYRTEPKSGKLGYCLSMTDGRCNWPRGKALGGTSVINFMIYTRGARADYDEWEAMGNPGWAYRDVLPYFLKSENSRLKYQDQRYHSLGGYLDVSNVPYVSRLRQPFLQSAKEFGYKFNDYNGESLMGFSPVQANLRFGRRVSASKAFLDPIVNRRKNLRISTFSRVTKILVNSETRRASAVKFIGINNNKTYVARARREVLLCAGTLNSPQLLMLSGIGPKAHLESFGIKVLEDLPVGQNLQDHVSMSALTFLVNDSVTIIEPRLVMNPINTFDYLLKGSGPFTVPGGAEALAFIDTKSLLENRKPGKGPSSANYPDIELVLGIGALTGDVSGSLRSLFGFSDDFERRVFSHYKGLDAFSIVPILMRPKSRGRVSLRSANPMEPPILEANYYERSEDLDTIVRGIKAAIKVASSRAFKRFNATLLPVAFPGCEHLQFASDDYWACVARHVSTTLGHFTSTCRMAPRAQGGVVDSRLRVYGIQGLRVVDASVMPEIIAGHTCAPTYMIGEKAADMIKQDWAVLKSNWN
ncbi:hypothetical protein TSAR_005556 [Trichomalopsis sarcophagae]|uniref:Glucose-methanol-choline oxidoreductase N-terminal domain-containing protein n=1 Tax=Trichomalopsis sarcophagae TaxID=543379 RepID=A0A232EQ64_9HYME|nr:hypothetical protein TSAR_005556 [Trichomalopsis sarcophagae]